MSDEEGDALTVMLGNGVLDKKKDVDASHCKRHYSDEWSELCSLAEKGLQHVQRHAVQMHLQGSRLRSVYWQILLGSLPISPALWVPILRQQRNSYRLLHQRLTIDPHKANSDDDPLSQSSSSSWHQYFCDKELRALVRQDVVRTFPSVEFFRSESIQCTMVNILFCYAREHPEMCYRQGMHEVLAPLLFVMQSDQQSLLQAQEIASVSHQSKEILDTTCLEEDCYWLFCSLMSHVAGNYRIKNVTPLLTGHIPLSSKVHDSNILAETEVATRLRYIRDELLPLHDQELYQHLCSLDIHFQTFGIRWLRVMFGQEFPLKDLLYLWDAIFSEGDGFDLVNYVFVSMLLAIKDQLMVEDDTECLMRLMRYPSGVNVVAVVERALYMWKPAKYSYLQETFVKKEPLVTPLVKRQTVTQSPTISGRFKKLNLWSQKKDSSTGPSATPASFDVPVKVTSSAKPALNLQAPEKNRTVVEGYTLNDPEVARAELSHLQNLVAFVHSHLERYHSILEHSLNPNAPLAVQEALVGIKELSFQLGRYKSPANQRVLEVEAAAEAEPAPQVRTVSAGKIGTSSPSNETPSSKSVKECPLNEIKPYEGKRMPSCMPMNNPLQGLHLQLAEKDLSLHVNFCRVLGTEVI